MRTRARWIGIWVLALVIATALGVGCLADSQIRLSDSQRDQLKALAANTRDRTGRERDALRRARMELLQTYYSYDIDDHKAKAGRDKIGAAQLNLLNIHLDNEIALRGIFTSDQFLSFRDMMKKRMRDPRMLVLAPPEEDILDRLPNKRMLDSLGISTDQRKRLEATSENIKAIGGLRDDSKQLLDLYSAYDLDSSAARKLIDGIHRKQVFLLVLQHHRQKTIRQVLSEQQFQSLQREIAKKMAERRPRREHERRR